MYSTYVDLEQLERKQINNNRNSYTMASARMRRASPTSSSEFLLMKDSRDRLLIPSNGR